MKRVVALLAAAGLLLVGCGDSSDDEASSADAPQDEAGPGDDHEAEFPVTIVTETGQVEIAEEPTAIISISPTATEMLFAIGAGDQVEAVDDNSNFPAEAPTSELSSFEPNAEAIAAMEPDLVVAATDAGDLVGSLEALDIPVLLLPAAVEIDDTFEQIEQLGSATGHVGEAADLVAEMQREIEDIVAAVPEAEPPTFYHELDNTFFSVTSATFIGKLYEMAGLRNIADAADDGTGYPQLSAEYIIQEDPDLVFLADTKCCGQNAETVAQRPGWDQLTAVQQGRVVELDDDVASRWGPRIVDLLRVIVDATAAVPA